MKPVLTRLRVRDVVLFVWSAAVPIHPLPIGPSSRLGGGEWLFPIVLAVAIAVVFRATRDERREASAPFALVPFAVIAAGLLPAVIVASDTRTAAIQWVGLLYVATILAVTRVLTALDARAGTMLLAGLVAGTLVRVAWGWLDPSYIAWMSGRWPRPQGFAESPNMIAVQAGAAAIALTVLRPRRWVIAIAMVVVGVTVLATLGHVVFAAFATVTFAAWRALSRRGSRRAPFAAAFAIAAAAFLALSMRVDLLPLRASPPFVSTNPSMYAAAHSIAVETFADRPLTGVGLEGFYDAWRARDDGTRFLDRVPKGCPECATKITPLEPHSTWLGYLAEAGLPGGITVLMLAVLAVRAARRRDDEALEIALTFAGTLSVMLDVLTNRELALVIGVLLGRRQPGYPRRER